MSDEVRETLMACMALSGINIKQATEAAEFMLGDDCRLIITSADDEASLRGHVLRLRDHVETFHEYVTIKTLLPALDFMLRRRELTADPAMCESSGCDKRAVFLAKIQLEDEPSARRFLVCVDHFQSIGRLFTNKPVNIGQGVQKLFVVSSVQL